MKCPVCDRKYKTNTDHAECGTCGTYLVPDALNEAETRTDGIAINIHDGSSNVELGTTVTAELAQFIQHTYANHLPIKINSHAATERGGKDVTMHLDIECTCGRIYSLRQIFAKDMFDKDIGRHGEGATAVTFMINRSIQMHLKDER